jgi:hypothetical protein
MSKKKGVFKNLPNGKTVRRHTIPPGQQWTWWTIQMIESPAYRALSLSAHRVIARIRLEHARHGGKENGRLPVTHRDFHKYGVTLSAVAPAIREAQALGFIRITEHGVASAGEFGKPTLFELTHLPVNEAPATSDWNKIESIEEATAVALAARREPARHDRISRKGERLRSIFPLRKKVQSASESEAALTDFPLRKAK